MKSMIKELWRRNIMPQAYSREPTCRDEYASLTKIAIFVNGFKLEMQIAIEIKSK